MGKEDEKESSKDLFAKMQRVASRNDFLYDKILEVMGDYVEAQSFISDSIYVSHQDRELLLPLFPPRRLDVSYRGFGPRDGVYQSSVKVAPLQYLPPKPIPPLLPPPPPPLQVMTKDVPGTPKTKPSGASIKTQEIHEDCSSTDLNSRSTPSPANVNIQCPSDDTVPVPEIQLSQIKTSVKSTENIESKQREDLSPLLQNQFDKNPKIDIGDVIKEMTLPRLISPINSPESRMSVEVVFEEMVTDIFPLSPISNSKMQDFTVLRKEKQNISSVKENCGDENRNINLHLVQDILGDISSSSEEEEKETTENVADPSARKSNSPKVVDFDITQNLSSIEENNSKKLDAPNLCKGDSKITRSIFPKNLFESSKTEQRPAVDFCSKMAISKPIPENSEKETRTYQYPKEKTNSIKRPVSSSYATKSQLSQPKIKIAPPSASQIVSRPKKVMPLCLQGKDKQKISSNILQTKDNASRHSQPPKYSSPKTQRLIGSSCPIQYHQQTTVATNDNVVSIGSSISKNVCVASNSHSVSSDHQTFKPVLTADPKSSSTRLPKDVCLPDKIDTIPPENQSPIAELISERALPNPCPRISITPDSVSKESKPSAISSHEKSPTHNFSPANRQVTLLKDPPCPFTKRHESSNERDNDWAPQKEIDKILCKKLLVSPYKLSPSDTPKAEPSFPKIKGKKIQVKINIELMNENCRNYLYSQMAKRKIPPPRKSVSLSSSSIFSDSTDNQRRRRKTLSKKLLIKLDTKLLSSIHIQKDYRHPLVEEEEEEEEEDVGPLPKRLCSSSLLRDWRQTPQEMIEIENEIKKLLKENSKSCYSRAKYFNHQAKIMKKKAQMFLQLLAANWFVLCSYKMEKEGRSLNSVRKHWKEMGSFLNDIGCFEDVRMESLRYLLRAVICQRLYELSIEKRQQLKTELNTEYKSMFGIPLNASDNVFRKCLDHHQKKHGNDNLQKSISVSSRFVQLNREYQKLVELLVKAQEFLSKAQKQMQEKCEFFNLVKCRLRNLNIYPMEIPLIVDFVKTCLELLQPKELEFVIAAQNN